MPSAFHTINTEGISVTLDLRVGHIRELVITRDGRTLAPFHTAPWVDDPSIRGDETIPGSVCFLSGDFLCAPFSTSDVEHAPPHGWTADSPWQHAETIEEPDGVTAPYRLEQSVMGARVEKRFTTGEVFSSELLGDATLVAVKLGPDLVTVKVGPTEGRRIGEQVGIAVDPARIHLFDAGSGRRMQEPR